MSDGSLPSELEWGYLSSLIAPNDLIDRLREQTETGIAEYQVLPEREPCMNQPGFYRISVTIPLPPTLFDQLMNGSTGYRAHYYVGIETGENFNRRLVEAIAPIVERAEHLYRNIVTRESCEKSLSGTFSKFWFSKEITDPSGQEYLSGLEEVINVERWRRYWRGRPKPWKGLLAPQPEDCRVLMNGTFVDLAGEEYEQKSFRSQEVFESGWA